MKQIIRELKRQVAGEKLELEQLKGLPRDSYQLMTKVETDRPGDPHARFDQMRQLSQTDYFDIMPVSYTHLDVYKRQD